MPTPGPAACLLQGRLLPYSRSDCSSPIRPGCSPPWTTPAGILKAQPPLLQHLPAKTNREPNPDLFPLLQHCFAKALYNRVADTSGFLQDLSPRLASWLARRPQGGLFAFSSPGIFKALGFGAGTF